LRFKIITEEIDGMKKIYNNIYVYNLFIFIFVTIVRVTRFEIITTKFKFIDESLFKVSYFDTRFHGYAIDP